MDSPGGRGPEAEAEAEMKGVRHSFDLFLVTIVGWGEVVAPHACCALKTMLGIALKGVLKPELALSFAHLVCFSPSIYTG